MILSISLISWLSSIMRLTISLLLLIISIRRLLSISLWLLAITLLIWIRWRNNFWWLIIIIIIVIIIIIILWWLLGLYLGSWWISIIINIIINILSETYNITSSLFCKVPKAIKSSILIIISILSISLSLICFFCLIRSFFDRIFYRNSILVVIVVLLF